VVIELKDFHLDFNFSGSFLALWVVRVRNLRFFFTNMSFGQVLNFLSQFFRKFTNLELLIASGTFWIIIFFEFELASSANNFSAIYAFFNVKRSLLTLETRIELFESFKFGLVIWIKVLLGMCSYQAFDLLVGDVQEYSFKLKYRLIFVH
jgi:hypothetical protein